MSKPNDKTMTNAARRLYQKDGEIEVDEFTSKLPTARVSRGDDPGAYVMAWVWVYDKQVTAEDRG